jgi:1-acyl-sn-glycerol-3-phosphate acyltransferase
VEKLSGELNPEQPPAVGPTTHLEWDLGLGSIERHELLMRLEKGLGERLSSQGVFQASTVSDLLDLTPGSGREQQKGVVEFAVGEVPPHPAHAENLIEALLYQVEHQPARKTLHFIEEDETICEWAYPDLLAACQKVAAGLNALGVQPGDRVGVMLPSGPDYLAAFYGVMWIGAIPTPLYPPFRLDQLEDYVKRQAAILEIAGVEHLISFDKAKPVMPLFRLHCPSLKKIVTVAELDGVAPPPRPHQHALIQFTSGSTGLPKGVVLSHANLIHNIRGYGFGMNLGKDDVTISWLPLYHDMGLIGTMLGSVYHGQPLALMGPQDFLARPSRWLWAIHRYRGTVSPAPNFAYEICARKIPDEELEGLDLSSWRIALNGAEAVRPETLQRFTERFAPYGFRPEAHFPAYGLAEASLAVTFPPPGRGPLLETLSRERLESEGIVASCGPDEPGMTLVACGRPLPDMEVRIVDEHRQVLPDQRRGLVEFRGPSSMVCYYNHPEATAATKDEEGWVKTGDLGYLSEGELYLTGRIKDIIIKAGRNIQAEDVEDMVAAVEGVRRGCVAAFGVEDENEGTELLVIVAECRSRDESVRKKLAGDIERQVSKMLGLPPDRVEVVASHTVPKTPSGKIRRSECKKRWQSGDLKPSGRTLAQLKSLVAEGVRVYGRQAREFPKKWARKAWCHSLLGGAFLAPQIISLVSPKLARKSLGALARLYLRAVGVHLDVRGQTSHPGPCVLVCNHCSTLDALVLCAVWETPLTFLVAPWVSRLPTLKYLIQRLGHIPVHRGDPKAVAAQEELLVERLNRGESLAIFPEGGVEVTPGLRPFALGAFQLAAKAGVPVIPVALQGTRAAQPYPNQIPFPVPLMGTVGPPLPAESEAWASVLDLSNRARAWIAEHCGDPLSHRRLRRVD